MSLNTMIEDKDLIVFQLKTGVLITLFGPGLGLFRERWRLGLKPKLWAQKNYEEIRASLGLNQEIISGSFV